MTVKDYMLDTFYWEIRRLFSTTPMTIDQQEHVISLMAIAYEQGFADSQDDEDELEDDRLLN